MNIEATIADLEERLRQAQLASNIDELSALLNDNLIFSALDGSVIGKADDLNLYRSGDFHITKMDVLNRTIQCHENAAVVNVLMDASAQFGDTTQSDKIRYIRVWYKAPIGWRIISGSMRIEGAGA